VHNPEFKAQCHQKKNERSIKQIRVEIAILIPGKNTLRKKTLLEIMKVICNDKILNSSGYLAFNHVKQKWIAQ
jgi:hypothetical protein